MFLAVCAKDPVYLPDPKAITRIASYLEAIKVGHVVETRPNRVEMRGGKNFGYLGVEVRSDPVSFAIEFSEVPFGSPDDLDDESEDWERELSARRFNFCFSDPVPHAQAAIDDPRNPVWPIIKRWLGDQELIQFYCSS